MSSGRSRATVSMSSLNWEGTSGVLAICPTAGRVHSTQTQIEKWNRDRLVPVAVTSYPFGEPSPTSDYAPSGKGWRKKSAGPPNSAAHPGKIATLIRVRSEFRAPQEIKIPRRIQPQVSDPVRVHHDIVEIPQINVWQILSQNALHLGIQRLARLRIDIASCLVDQRIDLRVGIV